MLELSEIQLLNLIKCNQCALIAHEPKVMPCGANICAKCAQTNQRIQCKYCNLNHSKEQIFPNNSLKQLFQLYESNRVNRNETSQYDLVTDESESVKLFESVKALVEQEYNSAQELINSSVNQLIREIIGLKEKLLAEVSLSKQENLANLDQNFYLNLTQDEQNNPHNDKHLLNFDSFVAKNNISVKLIGEINYGAYKIDLLKKLKNLNNTTFHVEADLSPCLKYGNVFKKKFGILDKNKIFFLFERFFGNVNSLYMRIIHLDGTIMHTNQVNATWSFHSHCVHDKHILVAFRTKTSLYHMNLFNDKLDLIKSFPFYLELLSIFMDDKYIYLIAANSKHVIYMYDYNFNLVDSLGQTKYERKAFYLKGEIIAICPDKIFLKRDKILNLICKQSGATLESFNFEFDQVFADRNYPDRLLMYKKHSDLCLTDRKGTILFKNNLENNSNQYEELVFTKSGHFCFVNNKNNKILIV